MAVVGLSQVLHLMSSLSLTVTQKRRNMTCKRDSPCPLLRRQMPRWPTKKQMKQSLSTASSESPTIPSIEQPEEDDARMEDGDSATTSSADEGDCLSNRPAPPEACPAQDEMLAAEDETRSMLPPQGVDPQGSSPTSHSSESPIKRRPGSKASAGRLSPRSNGNHLLQHPGNRSVASLNTSNHRLHWQTWPVGMLKGRRLPFAGTPRHHLTILDQRKSAHT